MTAGQVRRKVLIDADGAVERLRLKRLLHFT